MKPTQIAATMASLVSLVMAGAAPPANGGVADAPLQVRQQVDDILPMSDMTWTGPIFPGDATNTTLSGSAKSIYEQILAINPKYAEENPVPDVEPPSGAQVEKRDGISCSYGGPVFYPNCDEGRKYLKALGGGSGWCGANARSCARVSCSWKCGMQLCNTSGGYVQVYCRDIANDIEAIINRCWFIMDGWNYANGRYTFGNHYTQLEWDSC
ncbi:hypothetical protein B0H66DRAFT_620377 [Apodospora peruviana]|uniref:Secreted protein n=1 Tax=Apodospora peruviana TaxID=516989 RepID=A0AAE0M7Y7_9PEZI|nr:hypothetical protein B0H66DRAFT_620377 [Apodospora peruviana]